MFSEKPSYFIDMKIVVTSPGGLDWLCTDWWLKKKKLIVTEPKPDPYLMVGPRRDRSEDTVTVLLLSCAWSPLSARAPALPGALAMLGFRCVSLPGFMRPPPPFSPALFRFEFIAISGQSDCLLEIGFAVIVVVIIINNILKCYRDATYIDINPFSYSGARWITHWVAQASVTLTHSPGINSKQNLFIIHQFTRSSLSLDPLFVPHNKTPEGHFWLRIWLRKSRRGLMTSTSPLKPRPNCRFALVFCISGHSSKAPWQTTNSETS